MQILKPGDVAVIQLPDTWSTKQIRLEQGRVQRHLDKTSAGIGVVLVGGGDASLAAPRVEDLLDDESDDESDSE